MDGFVQVYKRHTPFAISNYEQKIINGSIKIDKVGDVLLYLYLYTDVVGFDWRNNIKSIKFYIGGQLINTWDTNYLIDYEPSFISKRFDYREGLSFLPIPVKMLPTKNLRFHEVEFVIDNVTLAGVSCFSMFAFLYEDIPDAIQPFLQVDKYYIGNDPIMIHGLVKFLVSSDIQQPDYMLLDGTKVTLAPLDVYRMNHIDYETTWDFTNPNSYDLSTNILPPTFSPITAQILGTNIFIFSTTSTNVLVYNTTLYFGSTRSYTLFDLPYPSVWTSASDGNVVYCCTIDGHLMRIQSNFSVTNLVNVGFRVYELYYVNNYVFMVGDTQASVYSTSTNTIVSTPSWSGTRSSVFFDGVTILIYTEVPSSVQSLNTQTLVYQSGLPTATVDFSGSSSYQSYDVYSKSITVNGLTYYSPGHGSTFTRSDGAQYTLPYGSFSTVVYDGSSAMYLYPYVGNTIIRYSLRKNYTMFIPFCLKTNGDPSGGVDLSLFKNISFSSGKGSFYAVRYNFLSIQNGMAAKLFS